MRQPSANGISTLTREAPEGSLHSLRHMGLFEKVLALNQEEDHCRAAMPHLVLDSRLLNHEKRIHCGQATQFMAFC